MQASLDVSESNDVIKRWSDSLALQEHTKVHKTRTATIDIDAIDGVIAIATNKHRVDLLQAQAVLLLLSQRNYMKALELMHAAGYVERAVLFARVLGEFNILPTGDGAEDTSRWR